MSLVTYVHKRSPSLSARERLRLAAFFDAAPMSSISSIKTRVDCAQATKNDVALFHNLKVLWAKGSDEKDSASASVIINAIVRNAPGKPHVFVKLSFGRKYDGLYYERLIYCLVTTPLVRRHITPCIVPFLGYVAVNGVFDRCQIQDSKICEAIIKSGFRGSLATHAHALITEMSDGVKLFSYDHITKVTSGWAAVEKPSRSMDDWTAVWFQIVYTLAAFGEIGACAGTRCCLIYSLFSTT